VNRRPQQMELFPASQIAESLGNNDRLMEMILERNNIIRAWKQVCANKGAPGVDGMKTGQLGNYLAKHWPEIEQDLLNCRHKPLPVKRKEIPKPDGGVRLLGIPTVLDRFIQQAIAQILEQVWNLFSLNTAMDSGPTDPHTMRWCRVKGIWLKVIHMS